MKIPFIIIIIWLALHPSRAFATTVAELEKKVAALEALVLQLLENQNQNQNQNQNTVAYPNPNPNPNPNPELTNPEIEVASLEAGITKVQTKHDDDIDDITYAVKDQEVLYDELAETINKSVKISGYADVEYLGAREPEGRDSFRMHHLSVFFSKNFENNIKFFSEIEYEDAPKFNGINDGSGQLDQASGTILVESMNFDWHYSQQFNLRVGRFFTPAGIWSEDHYPPFVATQERPLHIFNLFPQVIDGVSSFGSFDMDNHGFFDYNLFVGNGESNISGKKDLNSSKAVGFRGNFHFNWLDDFNTGFTLYRDGNDSANGNASKSSYGAHLKARYQSLSAQLEYTYANLSFDNAFLDYQAEGYYAQLTYNLNAFDIGVRYDVFDKTDLTLDKTSRNSLFINYHLDENITLKGEYHYDISKDPLIDDNGFYIFSISGFLGR